VATGSSDSCIKIWSFVEGNEKGSPFLSPNNFEITILMADNFVEKQTIELNGRYPLASALAYLPRTNG